MHVPSEVRAVCSALPWRSPPPSPAGRGLFVAVLSGLAASVRPLAGAVEVSRVPFPPGLCARFLGVLQLFVSFFLGLF